MDKYLESIRLADGKLLESLVKTIPVMLCFYDMDGNVLFVNPAFERATGLSLETCRKIDIMETCYPDPDYRREIWEFMMHSNGEWRDMVITRQDGSILETSWTNIILDETTQVGIGIDITERRQAEREREEYEARLHEAREVSEKTAKMASIGILTGGISHEINQPLTAIKITVDGLLYYNRKNPGAMPDLVRRKLEDVTVSVENLEEIIHNMLDYWRKRDDSFDQTVNVHDALIQAIELTRNRLNKNSISLSLKLYEHPIHVRGNASYLELIFLNLINNAVHAMKKTEPAENRSLVLATERDGGDVRITVADTGPGIDDGIKEKVFEPRFTTRQEEGGTGLGLAIVRSFVENFNGTIGCQDTEGGGVTFVITLPLVK